MYWKPIPGVPYQRNYIQFAQDIEDGKLVTDSGKVLSAQEAYRWLFSVDLWALLYFGLQTEPANHPFWIKAAWEVQTGPKTDTIDLWAREHGKSTIITLAENIQDIINNPNERICLFSYTRDTAKVFFSQIKRQLESNEYLLRLYPDIFWEDTNKSPQWNDEGIIVKRTKEFKECTVEAWGLITGMPTARHFTKRVYDDIVTLELVSSPKVMQETKEKFDMSENVGSDNDRRRVVGTFYHHDDVLTYLCGQKKLDGTPAWHIRMKPATEDGTSTGKPVLLSQEKLDKLKLNKKQFNTQQLLNPTPKEDELLPYERITHCKRSDMPENVFKFMMVDPAKGKRADGREADAWAMWVVGVDPYLEDTGASRVFIIDGFVGVLSWEDGLNEVANVYLRNGWIHRLGVEEVGLQTTTSSVRDKLKVRGRVVSLENGMMQVLRPGNRNKQLRIESNLAPPLRTGLIHMLDSVPALAREQLRLEMEKYPMWRDDGMDALAFLWDMLADYIFPKKNQPVEKEPEKDIWAKYEEMSSRGSKPNDWMRF